MRITIAAINDAPEVTVPASRPWRSTKTRTGLITGVSVADVDAAEGTGQVRLTATVVNGTLTVSTKVPNGVPPSKS